MTSKGRRRAYLTITLGVVVLLAAGYAFRDKALEQWYIWKLESDDEQSRKDAAARLAEMGAVGAVPAILEILDGPGIFGRLDPAVLSVPSGPPSAPSAELLLDANATGRIDEAEQRWLVPSGGSFFLFHALWKLTSVTGKRSTPYLVTALDDSGSYAPYLSALLLGRIGPDARGAIPALTTALRHESELVRLTAAEALKRIQGEQPEPSE